MLTLKLVLVPLLLAMVTLATRRFGPGVGGALAGMPWALGPILTVLLLEQGPEFAASAATVALAAIPASAACLCAMAWASRQRSTLVAIVAGVCAWLLVAMPLTGWLPSLPTVGLAMVVGGVLWCLPRLLPAPTSGVPGGLRAAPNELAVRMIAGAALTLLVSAVAERSGVLASGALAAFPIITVCVGGFTLRDHGSEVFILLAHGMTRGYWALMAFPLTLSLTATQMPWPFALAASIAASALAQFKVGTRLRAATA